MRVTFEFYGEEQAKRQILRPAEKAQDLRPIWPRVFKELTDIEREQFGTEGGRSGRPWQELAEATTEKKSGDQILVESGALFRSWTRKSHGGGAIRRMRKNDMEFSGRGYGIHHQRGHGALPVRKVVDLVERDKNQLVKIMQAYIFRGIILK